MSEIRKRFIEIFGGDPRVFRAPGRVNLIGEHTDYNEGFVMPFAIDRESQAAGRPRNDLRIRIHAIDVGESHEFDLSGPPVKMRGDWRDYAEGTTRSLQRYFEIRHGADMVFSSTVPIGAGLSSSAAIEVSIGIALLALNEIEIDRRKLAFAAQAAEHEFVGIRSGIMDQFTSALAKEGNALLLDCRSLETEDIPLSMPGTIIAVCDTKVKHELASTEYNTRREECEEGVRLLSEHLPGIKSLRDVVPAQFEKFQSVMPENIRKRARHVITENLRTLDAADALRARDAEQLGQLMYGSHSSLRDDYEVSSPELDKLVEIAGSVEGVYGARMTGGGFGGCTVNLLLENAMPEFSSRIAEGYPEAFGFEPDIYLFKASGGAGEIA